MTVDGNRPLESLAEIRCGDERHRLAAQKRRHATMGPGIAVRLGRCAVDSGAWLSNGLASDARARRGALATDRERGPHAGAWNVRSSESSPLARSHRYQLPLQAGDYVRVAIDQQAVDVGARLFAPDGTLVIDASYRQAGRRYLSAIAATTGNYQLDVVCVETSADHGAVRREDRPTTSSRSEGLAARSR